MAKDLVLGIDYGTDSVRTLVVDAANGREITSAVCAYPRWAEGKFCSPRENRFRQHPLDYIEGLEKSVKSALKKAPKGSASRIRGIGIDTTGSTPCAVDKNGTPLALLPEFKSNPDAMFVLWKDHTSVAEAAMVNELSRTWGGTDFTAYEGGVYSSEWFWAKIARILKTDDAVAKAAWSWVEHCDWMPALLTGTTDPAAMKRSRCSAGHKAMWHPKWGGLPSEDFLIKLEPRTKGLRARLYAETVTADKPVGTLTKEWAKRLGLSSDVVVAAGAFDAHMGAVGAGIRPGQLVKVIGTSTCDIMTARSEEIGDRVIRGICGQVDGSVLPGFIGLEAGQSAFGDIYAWFGRFLAGTAKDKGQIIAALSREAERLPADLAVPLCLDWMNGRRTPDADQRLKGAIAGLSLGSTPAEVFKGLVESTAFGARAIAERFVAEGAAIREVLAIGGVAKKSGFVMQTLSDIMKMPIKVADSDQCCALGAAIFGAVAAGLHPDTMTAVEKMSSDIAKEYLPRKGSDKQADAKYAKYLAFASFVENNLTDRG
jgi:L-ribulokinase